MHIRDSISYPSADYVFGDVEKNCIVARGGSLRPIAKLLRIMMTESTEII